MKLTVEELQEFRLRRNALEYARNVALMVEESYNDWCSRAMRAHGLAGRVNIDSGTGEITKVEDGGSDEQRQAA